MGERRRRGRRSQGRSLSFPFSYSLYVTFN